MFVKGGFVFCMGKQCSLGRLCTYMHTQYLYYVIIYDVIWHGVLLRCRDHKHFPHVDGLWSIWNRQLFETLWQMGTYLVIRNFCFCHYVIIFDLISGNILKKDGVLLRCRYHNQFPHVDGLWCIWNRQLFLKTLWQMETYLVMSNFFLPHCYYLC